MDNNANLPTSTTAAPLPTQLTRWSPWLSLDSEAWDVKLIAAKFWGELDQIAAAAKAAAEQRATPAELGEIFKRLALACRGQPGETTDRKATMALFLRYLCNYSAEILAQAVDEWISTQVFMPAISELKKLADARLTKLERAWRRAAFLAGHSRSEYRKRAEEAEWARREQTMAPEKAAALQAKIEEGWKKLGGRSRGDGTFEYRHPSNRDTDSPEEKARIARICAEARANAALKREA